MCETPNIFDGIEVSCRECDHCAATYKNTWVARCMAELQTNPHALAFTLTYADIDQPDGSTVAPLGAMVFRYKDVQNFWKRLRKAGVKKFGKEFQIRYVIVGEKGSRFGRCHYHGVMFSNHPIQKMGEFVGARSAGFALKRRLDWSIWGHGFVEFQPATRKGMSYALKYILKARMTAKRSKGRKREGKTEYLASSYLWCSKRPAIGAHWLWKKLHDLADKGMVPPSLRFRVPGGGDWYVSGELQRDVCLWLHELKNNSDRPLAGWSSLLASVSEPIENLETGEFIPRKPWEWLTNGEQIEEVEPFEDVRATAAFEHELFAAQSRAFGVQYARTTSAKCGGFGPCPDCKADFSQVELDDYEQHYALAIYEFEAETGRHATDRDFQAHCRSLGEPSSYCYRRFDSFTKAILEYAGRLARAAPKNVQSSSR